jgi:hypothetical protein
MSKGGNWERVLSRELSLWWTQDLSEPRDDCLWRTSNSGGRATTRAKTGRKTSGHCGDLTATDEVAMSLIRVITIEAKRGYSSETVADVLDRSASAAQQTWEAWVQQAMEASARAGTKYWLIIQRRDRRMPFCFMPSELYFKLPLYPDQVPVLRLQTDIRLKNSTQQVLKNQGIVGMTLESFLTNVKPKHIRNLMIPEGN